MFEVRVEIGDPERRRYQQVDAVVDTGSTYTTLPASTLRDLGVTPHARQRFVVADGRSMETDIGQTWIRIDGREQMTVVVFAEEETQPLLGAVTLEEFGLGVDPVAKRLIPVVGYRL